MDPSDTALLRRWVDRRDADAFNELANRYAGMVYATCMRVLGNQADAEEVTQDCFLRLAEGDAPVRRSFGGWLHRLATHRCLNRIRSEKRRSLREKRFAEQAVPP
ncbi:RNA polymerase sigma factor, partial [Candidatus Hydrogenedentota bacterium]